MRHEPGQFVRLIDVAREPVGESGDFRQDRSKPDLGAQIRWLTGVLLRRRWLIASFAFLGAVLAGIAALAVPPSYTATAQVLVLPEQGSGESDESAIDTQITMLSSDARLRRVLDSMEQSPGARADGPGEPLTAVERLRTGLRGAVGLLKSRLLPADSAIRRASTDMTGVGALKQSLSVTQERRSRVIAVRYTDRSPDKAAVVANKIVQVHIESLRNAKQADANWRTEWFDRQIAAAQTEMTRAEADLRSYLSTHGTKKADSNDLELIAERRKQLALVQAEAGKRQEKLEKIEDLRRNGVDAATMLALLDPPLSDQLRRRSVGSDQALNSDRSSQSLLPAASAPEGSSLRPSDGVAKEIDREILKLGSEAQMLRAQAQSIEQHLASLQRAANSDANDSVELSALERRVAATAKQIDELRRRQQESAGQNELASLQARVLAPASRPSQPNSISPVLIVTAALVAFGMLGSMVAVTMDRLDRTLRSERDVSDALGIPCIGFVPEFSAAMNKRHNRDLLAEYDLRCCSIVIRALQLSAAHRSPRILLVTSSLPDESKTTLAMSFGMSAARLGRKVLLVDFRVRQNRSARNNHRQPSTDLLERFLEGDPADAIRVLPELGFDHLAARQIGIDLPVLFSDERTLGALTKLGGLYDCVVIDGPAVLGSEEARLLATIADEVIFVVRWASTTEDVARHALEVLRQSAGTVAGTPARFAAVLSRVDLSQKASTRDVAELRARTSVQGAKGRFMSAALDPDRFIQSARATLAGTAAFAAPWAGAVLGSGDRIIRSAAALLSRSGASVLSKANEVLVYRIRGAADPGRSDRRR
jgi:uncharacterized protein involved in exopolysaccharide biosynthesis/MinD-like ATPase involved in chromosome partitioning or flagellar assembly